MRPATFRYHSKYFFLYYKARVIRKSTNIKNKSPGRSDIERKQWADHLFKIEIKSVEKAYCTKPQIKVLNDINDEIILGQNDEENREENSSMY